jgi:hypothetical protein
MLALATGTTESKWLWLSFIEAEDGPDHIAGCGTDIHPPIWLAERPGAVGEPQRDSIDDMTHEASNRRHLPEVRRGWSGVILTTFPDRRVHGSDGGHHQQRKCPKDGPTRGVK